MGLIQALVGCRTNIQMFLHRRLLFLPFATSSRAYFSLFLKHAFSPIRSLFIWQSRNTFLSGRRAALAACKTFGRLSNNGVAAGFWLVERLWWIVVWSERTFDQVRDLDVDVLNRWPQSLASVNVVEGSKWPSIVRWTRLCRKASSKQ